MKNVVKSFMLNLGRAIKNKAFYFRNNYYPVFGCNLKEEVKENINIVKEYTMVGYPRLVSLYQQVVFCEKRNIMGSFVECGTWKGGCVGLFALGNLKHGLKRRDLHLFDSFCGAPEPDEEIDGEKAIQQVLSVGGQVKGRLKAINGLYEKYATGVGTLAINKHLLEEIIKYDAGFIHYHQGWFQDTLPKDAPGLGSIAILRLDGDWYASTKTCLEYLYNKVARGGFVIIDDYGYYEGCRKAVDDFIKSNQLRVFLNYIDATGRYIIKP